MTISNRNTKYKRSGSILASVMVAAIVWIMIAQSMFITFSGQFKMISSSRTALQAQQYAEIALDKLKNINYDELDAYGVHGRQKIEGISSEDWQDEVTIGAESTIAGSDDAKQRIATVNVYKVGDTLPRYTVELPLSSQGGSSNGIQVDYSKPISISVNGQSYRPVLANSMTAPSNGIVLVSTSSNSYTPAGGTKTRSSYTYCNISGYGKVSSRANQGIFLVNKGDVISLGYSGSTGPMEGSTAQATFYPYK